MRIGDKVVVEEAAGHGERVVAGSESKRSSSQ